MARPYRLQVEEGFYHITSRGDNHKPIYQNQRDFEKFLEYLIAAKAKFKFYLYAYCLMTNHYHLFIGTTQANLSRIMQYLNTSYSVYYNLKHRESGHLFQGRYKSILVEEDAYFTELTRYIHLNPVRAKIVSYPADYRWSSYKAYLKGKTDTYVDIDRIKQYLDMDLKDYRHFVEAINDFAHPFKNVYAGFILGGEKFIKENLNRLQADVETKDFVYKRKIKNIFESEEIINEVARHYQIDVDTLKTSVRRPMLPKKTAIYLLRRRTGLTNVQIGEIFNMRPAAVSMAAKGLVQEMAYNKKLKEAVEKLDFSFRV